MRTLHSTYIRIDIWYGVFPSDRLTFCYGTEYRMHDLLTVLHHACLKPLTCLRVHMTHLDSALFTDMLAK